MICPEHVKVNLTSKEGTIRLNEQARILIAQIKMKQNGEIGNEILSEVSINATKPMHDDCADMDSINVEHNFLRQLNNELQERNGILREQFQLLNSNEEKPDVVNKSFAKVGTSFKPKPKRIPRVYKK